MRRRLLLSYLSITAFVLLVLETPLGIVFARLERSNLIAGVRQDATTIALHVVHDLEVNDQADLHNVVADYRTKTGGRVVVLDTRGVALADSSPGELGTEFVNRPEISGALKGQEVHGFRYSRTLGKTLLFVAVPVESAGVIHGVVRITYPSSFVDHRIRQTWLVLAGVGVAILGSVLAVSLRLARTITAPLGDLEQASADLGRGDLAARTRVPDGPPELRVLAEAFNDTAAKLERLMHAQRRFVASASHQLRTPLAALRLRLEILESEVGGSGSEDVQAALAEVHRLSRLVDGLLELAGVQQRTATPHAADVVAIIEGRRTSWLPLVEERGMQLAAEAAAPLHAAVTSGALEQVLDNLIANAVDASPDGTTITLRGVRRGPWVEVHVIDQGRGMSDDQRQSAFDALREQSGSDERLGGFGLGLSIVHELVVADGGEMELLPGPSGGTEAVVRLRAGRDGEVAGPGAGPKAGPDAPGRTSNAKPAG